jgi:hypothetical protein
MPERSVTDLSTLEARTIIDQRDRLAADRERLIEAIKAISQAHCDPLYDECGVRKHIEHAETLVYEIEQGAP